ncbi:MAG TPA: zinc-binding dehydrogenase [Acidimicrobiales bacterium]|nr:zinc-binding dehydrogenase [Acidimicrobiales bacterium]
MRAVTIVDGALEWRAHPDPEPGTGEVLVRVRAAGLNGADRLQVAGLYPAPPGSPPDIPGLELAGEVQALGPGATRVAVGDRVMAVVGGGGQAELAVVHERHLLPVPDGVPWEAAGGFPEAFTTAHDALFTQAELQLGERVCIHGAAGGVGVTAVQLAAAAGAHVTATVRDEGRRAQVAALGAHEVIAPDDLDRAGPFDVVLELIGAPNLPGDLRALATGGRIAVIGVGAGAKAEVNLLELMGKRARIHGSTLRARSLEDKADAARRVERHVLPLLAAGRVSVPVQATHPMADAPAAYAAFAAGGKLGKLVLTSDT